MNSTATIIETSVNSEISGLQQQLTILQEKLLKLRNIETQDQLQKIELEVDRLQRLILMRNKLR